MTFPSKTNYASGDILTAAQMNDIGSEINALNGAVGKNKIINGDFAINQRSFTSTTTTGVFGFDRWQLNLSGATATYSSQAFTLGTAPVVGYESKNFARLQVTTGNDFCRLSQAIESVRTFAGQTVTLSFWAKGTNPTTAGNVKASLVQNFGTGGSPSSTIIQQQTFILTGSWTRYLLTFNVGSISGKTIGTNGDDCLQVWFGQGDSTSTESYTIDIWGVQLEAGSLATAFQTATGTLQGELAACQRYYWRTPTASTAYSVIGQTIGAYATTAADSFIQFPVPMRVFPTSVDSSTLRLQDKVAVAAAITGVTLGSGTPIGGNVTYSVASGLTQYRTYYVETNNSTAGYIGFSAEL